MIFSLVQIGAHNGYKIYDRVVSLSQNGKNVLLIEPIPYLFNELQDRFRNVNNVFFENIAVSDEHCKRYLFYLNPESLNNKPEWADELGSFREEHIKDHIQFSPGEVEKIQVQCLHFDELIKAYSIEFIEELDIDTEGHDYYILKSFSFNKIKPRRIIFEHKHMDGSFKRGEKYKELVQFLAKLGYATEIVTTENAEAILTR